jgi:hypothetical protein
MVSIPWINMVLSNAKLLSTCSKQLGQEQETNQANNTIGYNTLIEQGGC